MQRHVSILISNTDCLNNNWSRCCRAQAALSLRIDLRSWLARCRLRNSEHVRTYRTFLSVTLICISQRYVCHDLAVTVQSEFRNPTVRRWRQVVAVTLSSILVFWMAIGWAGYLRFGEGVSASVLDEVQPINRVHFLRMIASVFHPCLTPCCSFRTTTYWPPRLAFCSASAF